MVIDTPLQCSLAIDSDAEFYALFGNKDDATNYVALLVGCEHSACLAGEVAGWFIKRLTAAIVG